MFNQRTNKLYQKIKEIVASGELGEIRRSNWIINTWWRPDSYYQQSEWRATWGGEGGGVLVNQAPHQLDLWQWICGIPTKVTSKNINGSHRKIDVENDVTIVTEYANGATGSFITCTHDAIGTDRLEIDLDGGKIVVEDSKKAKIYRMKKTEPEMNETMSMMDVAKLTMGNAAGGLYDLEEFENQDGWGYQHTTVMENFACHIIEGTPLLAPGSDGINGVNLAQCFPAFRLDEPHRKQPGGSRGICGRAEQAHRGRGQIPRPRVNSSPRGGTKAAAAVRRPPLCLFCR